MIITDEMIFKASVWAGRRLVHRFWWIETDDLFGYAALGVIEAKAEYDPDKDSSNNPEKFLGKTGFFRAIDDMRKDGLLIRLNRLPLPKTRSLFAVIAEGEHGTLSVVDKVKCPDNQRDTAESNEFFDRVVQMIPQEKDRFLVEMYFRYGWTFKKIGDVVGVSESRISQSWTGRIKPMLKSILSRNAKPASAA